MAGGYIHCMTCCLGNCLCEYRTSAGVRGG